jgi:hypothetical protein
MPLEEEEEEEECVSSINIWIPEKRKHFPLQIMPRFADKLIHSHTDLKCLFSKVT